MKNFDKNQQKELNILPTIGLILAMALALPSCKDEVAGTADNDKGGTVNKEKPSLLQSCKGWGSANLCLLTQEEGTGTITTPTLTFKGLDRINGNLRLFSDGDCSAVLGSPVVASVATVEITAPAQSTFTAEYYAQYTHTDNSVSPCLGPVAWTVEESPTLAFDSSAFSVPTFTLSELNVRAGSVGLFSDSACTVAASDAVDADSGSHRITANALTGYGSFEYYARHTDTAEQTGDCVGPVSYDFVSGLQETDPVLALHSGNDARDDDSTPTISLTALEFESGTIQLFSDETCTTAASIEADYTYSSSGTTVTANALATFGSTNFWAKITEGIENQSRCIEPVAYEYVDSLTFLTVPVLSYRNGAKLKFGVTTPLTPMGLPIQDDSGVVVVWKYELSGLASDGQTQKENVCSVDLRLVVGSPPASNPNYGQITLGNNAVKGDICEIMAYATASGYLRYEFVAAVDIVVEGFDLFFTGDGTKPNYLGELGLSGSGSAVPSTVTTIDDNNVDVTWSGWEVVGRDGTSTSDPKSVKGNVCTINTVTGAVTPESASSIGDICEVYSMASATTSENYESKRLKLREFTLQSSRTFGAVMGPSYSSDLLVGGDALAYATEPSISGDPPPITWTYTAVGKRGGVATADICTVEASDGTVTLGSAAQILDTCEITAHANAAGYTNKDALAVVLTVKTTFDSLTWNTFPTSGRVGVSIDLNSNQPVSSPVADSYTIAIDSGDCAYTAGVLAFSDTTTCVVSVTASKIGYVSESATFSITPGR